MEYSKGTAIGWYGKSVMGEYDRRGTAERPTVSRTKQPEKALEHHKGTTTKTLGEVAQNTRGCTEGEWQLRACYDSY